MQPRHDRADGAVGDDPAPERVWLSARDGAGMDLLREAIGGRLGLKRLQLALLLPTSAGRLRSRLHALDAIRDEFHDADGWRLTIDLPLSDALRLAADSDGAPLRPHLPPGEHAAEDAAWSKPRDAAPRGDTATDTTPAT